MKRALCAALLAAAVAARAGGGTGVAEHFNTEMPHLLMRESRYCRDAGFTTNTAMRVVKTSFGKKAVDGLDWDGLAAIHAKAKKDGPEQGLMCVTLRFDEGTVASEYLPRADAADAVFCAAFLAGWDEQRVAQTAIPGQPPAPATNAPSGALMIWAPPAAPPTPKE